MERKNIEKIAKTPEDRVLLGKIYDKIDTAMRRDIPGSTCFLSPRELEMARFLFGEQPGLTAFGGYSEAERKMLVYLPEYLEESALLEEDSPIACLRAEFFAGDSPTHRDFLGALIGAGIGRETIGDICVDSGSCDFFVTAELAPYLLQSFDTAGRTRLHLHRIPLTQVQVPQQAFQEIRDTLASLRLDSVISSGFRIARGRAAEAIAAGKAAINGLPCEKPDKAVSQGDKVSLRGFGKLQVAQVGGTTKKGRISVTLHKFL